MKLNLGTILTSVLMTVAGRLVTALGVSTVSYIGLNEIQKRIVSAVAQNIDSLPKEALQLIYIAGLGVCLNWIMGAFAFVISVKSLSRLSAGISKK